MKRIVLLTAALVGTAGALASGDVLRLKDGTAIEGDVKRVEGMWVVTLPDGGSVMVASESVRSIEAGAKGDPTGGLASLRRSTELATEPGPVIERYQRFIGQFPGTPIAEQAKKDLAVWQERQEKEMVRVGNQWVTKGERQQLQQEALQLANDARQQIKDGRWDEAGKLIDKALVIEPSNATALYLRGLIHYQSGQFVAARKDLEAVKAVAPAHGPTLNNLGVITARQNRFGEAISYFEQAMRAAPVDRAVLDNTAEALHALAGDAGQPRVQRQLAQRVQSAFNEQDPKLAERMKQEQGLNRWGATWVSDAQLEQLNEAQRQINERVTAVQAEFDQTQQTIASIDQRVAANEASLRQLEANAYRQDLLTGQFILQPLPPIYDELQRDIANMRVSRGQAVARLDALRRQAQSIERTLPVAKYTGTLQVVGADGAPIILAPAEAQANATRPAEGS